MKFVKHFAFHNCTKSNGKPLTIIIIIIIIIISHVHAAYYYLRQGTANRQGTADRQTDRVQQIGYISSNTSNHMITYGADRRSGAVSKQSAIQN